MFFSLIQSAIIYLTHKDGEEVGPIVLAGPKSVLERNSSDKIRIEFDDMDLSEISKVSVLQDGKERVVIFQISCQIALVKQRVLLIFTQV